MARARRRREVGRRGIHLRGSAFRVCEDLRLLAGPQVVRNRAVWIDCPTRDT